MEVQIPKCKNLFLTTDPDNWIICRKYQNAKNSKGKYYDHRYFSTLLSAINFLLDHVLKDCTDLSEIKQKQIEMAKWLKKELGLSVSLPDKPSA